MTEKSQRTGVSQARTAREPRAEAIPADQATRLRDVVAQVRRDSREQTEQYLDETTAPHGGE
ncbi:MAG: hypothetical protein ACQESR_31455 [Planctomycetota bacterium]